MSRGSTTDPEHRRAGRLTWSGHAVLQVGQSVGLLLVDSASGQLANGMPGLILARIPHAIQESPIDVTVDRSRVQYRDGSVIGMPADWTMAEHLEPETIEQIVRRHLGWPASRWSRQ